MLTLVPRCYNVNTHLWVCVCIGGVAMEMVICCNTTQQQGSVHPFFPSKASSWRFVFVLLVRLVDFSNQFYCKSTCVSPRLCVRVNMLCRRKGNLR